MASLLNTELNALEKIKRARVQIQQSNPFFTYLVMHLRLIEEKDLDTVGIDRYGNMGYNADWIDTLSDAELEGVLTHEVLHCALEHIDRAKGMNEELSNIAQDLVTNEILVNEGMTLPENGMVPYNHSYNIWGYTVEKLNEKTSEEVYDELYRHLGNLHNKVMSAIQNHIDKNKMPRFDKHNYGEDGKGDEDKEGNGEGKQKNDMNKNTEEMNWNKILIDAYAFGESQGHTPAGLDRIIGKLNETFIDWRGILYRYITSELIVDYNWSKPSKKSHSIGVYLPHEERESIDILTSIDTSGSISKNEFEDFVSELVGIVNSFKYVNLTVIDCDCKIHGIYNLRNTNADDIINKIKFKGGGGTSHLPVFDWISKHKPQAKLLIAFTDGYTDFPKEETIRTLWVVAGKWRANVKDFPFGEVIELPMRD